MAGSNRSVNALLPLTDTSLPSDYALAAPGWAVPVAALRPDHLARHDAQFHPRGLFYRVRARDRALAHHRARPRSVVAEWSALALLGLHDFADGADTTLLCTADARLASSSQSATVRRWTKNHQWTTIDGVKVTTPMTTLAACLKSLARREHAWDTLASLELDPVTVMSVQLIDRFRYVFGVDAEAIRVGLRGQIAAKRLERLLRLSCGGAESKPETVLRLLANEAVAGLDVCFRAQVPVYTDGTVGRPGEPLAGKTLLTVLDQADVRLRVGLMHDGEHHLQRSQRDKDAEITADLLASGWLLIRTSAGMLRKTRETKRRIRQAVEVALAGLAAS